MASTGPVVKGVPAIAARGHALHCLGIGDKRFTFKYQGLNHTPTGVEPTRVVKEILA